MKKNFQTNEKERTIHFTLHMMPAIPGDISKGTTPEQRHIKGV